MDFPDRTLSLLDEHLADYLRDALPLSLALGVFGPTRLQRTPRPPRGRAGDVAAPRTALGGRLVLSNLARLGPYRERQRRCRRHCRSPTRPVSQPAQWLGAHALARGSYEAGDAEAGAGFVAGWLPEYDRRSQLHGHLSWHLALCELARGNSARAHEIYADAIRQAVTHTPQVIKLANSPPFYGTAKSTRDDTGRGRLARSRRIRPADFSACRYAFRDLHAVLADAAIGDTTAAQQRIAKARERLSSGRLPQGEMVPVFGEGIVALSRGDYAAAVDLIVPMLPEVVRIGGIGAQRELFDDTYIVACLRAGRGEAARKRLIDRLARRPSERDRRWLASIG